MPTTNGAAIAPRVTSTDCTAFPRPSSCGSRYIALALLDAGSPADSATPNPIRTAKSPEKLLTNAVQIPATDHAVTAMRAPAFKPMRSISNPAIGAATIYAIENADSRYPYSVFERPNSDFN